MREKLQYLFMKQCGMKNVPKEDSDYEIIINDISEYLKDINSDLNTLSLNTMKRIFNHEGSYPNYDILRAQRETKKTICRYFGYEPEEWDKFVTYWQNNEVKTFKKIVRKNSVINERNSYKWFINSLKVNETFWVYVSGGLTLHLQKTFEKSRYRVINCIHGTALQRDDMVTISAFVKNKSLQVVDIMRRDKYRGEYITADEHFVIDVKKD